MIKTIIAFLMLPLTANAFIGVSNTVMSNTLWKIRFSDYEPIDLRDIQSYSIKQNVDDTSPIREEEMNEEIERKFKDNILYQLNSVLGGVISGVSWSKESRSFQDRDYEKLYTRQLDIEYEEKYYGYQKKSRKLFLYTIVRYLSSNKKVFANHFDNIEKWREKLSFAHKNIFECLSDYEKKKLKEYLILKKREKLFTVKFYLKDKTTLNWGAYKTKEEAEIVYNKVDSYFKKTFDHFYKNLDNQEIYSL